MHSNWWTSDPCFCKKDGTGCPHLSLSFPLHGRGLTPQVADNHCGNLEHLSYWWHTEKLRWNHEEEHINQVNQKGLLWVHIVKHSALPPQCYHIRRWWNGLADNWTLLSDQNILLLICLLLAGITWFDFAIRWRVSDLCFGSSTARVMSCHNTRWPVHVRSLSRTKVSDYHRWLAQMSKLGWLVALLGDILVKKRESHISFIKIEMKD